MIKMIFAKIRDETTFPENEPEFRAGFGEQPEKVKRRVERLFAEVVKDYKEDGIFEPQEKITLDAKGVAWVVGQLERGSLVETDADVVGDAFEVFAESKFVGEKGEFFTPRGVIEVAVKLTDPKPEETVCDPACGSGGFLIATMRRMWRAMEKDRKWRRLKAAQLQKAQQTIASRCFFGIEKESDLVRIAKAYMAVSGDGKSNVVQQNTLHAPEEYEGEAARRFTADGTLRQFDCVLTNPPYGTKTKVLKEEAGLFELGRKWTRSGTQWDVGEGRKSDPYVLFIERCYQMLKKGGRLGIVLPETVFHAPSKQYIRDWIVERFKITAVVDLPHNTFRPYCNAKTCLLVAVKGGGTQGTGEVVMAEAKEMGHDHNGKPLLHPGTEEVWNDLPKVMDELDTPEDPKNQRVFKIKWRTVEKAGNWVPRYFAAAKQRTRAPQGRRWVRLDAMVEDGTIVAWDGHGSPEAAEKGIGEIPYIRVKDIVNWEMYRNPTSGVSEEVYEEMTRNKIPIEAGDIIFVRRGSYRIGTVAMASPRDKRVLMTRELLTLRVKEGNTHGLTAYLLLALLSSSIVQEQMNALTFVDTTLPNIGERWKELRLPVPTREADALELTTQVKRAIDRKWKAQDEIDKLRQIFGDVVT